MFSYSCKSPPFVAEPVRMRMFLPDNLPAEVRKVCKDGWYPYDNSSMSVPHLWKLSALTGVVRDGRSMMVYASSDSTQCGHISMIHVTERHLIPGESRLHLLPWPLHEVQKKIRDLRIGKFDRVGDDPRFLIAETFDGKKLDLVLEEPFMFSVRE